MLHNVIFFCLHECISHTGGHHWLSFLFLIYLLVQGMKHNEEQLVVKPIFHRKSNQDTSVSGCLQPDFIFIMMINVQHSPQYTSCRRFPSTAFHPGSCNSHHCTSSFHLAVIALLIQWREKKKNNPEMNCPAPCMHSSFSSRRNESCCVKAQSISNVLVYSTHQNDSRVNTRQGV